MTTPAGLIVFYGQAAQLARDMGVPIFLDGDTGEVVRTPFQPADVTNDSQADTYVDTRNQVNT